MDQSREGASWEIACYHQLSAANFGPGILHQGRAMVERADERLAMNPPT